MMNNKIELLNQSEAFLKGKKTVGEMAEFMLAPMKKIAEEFSTEKVPQGDLEQEANLALMMALADVEKGRRAVEKPQELLELVEREVRQALKDFIAEELGAKAEAERIAERINDLADAVRTLDEMKVDISIEELSEFLEMSKEEIEDLLRLAGEEL